MDAGRDRSDRVVARAARDATRDSRLLGWRRRVGEGVGLLLTISQTVQALLVGLIPGVFHVGFGLLAVRRDTVLQWTTATEPDPLGEFGLLGDDVVLTWEHLAVSGFVAAFSALQFAVARVTDATYRDEFYGDVTGDVRDVLAVRAVVRAAAGQPASEVARQ